MIEKRILIFFDSKSQFDIDNFEFLLKNIDLNKYKIDLIIEENIKIKTSKKINILKFKQPTNIFQKYYLRFKLKPKTKYDCAIIYSMESLFGNYIIRKLCKKRILIADLKDKVFENVEKYRKYFIDRNIYDFEHIIFKNYQEQEKFIKYYPSLSKKTDVINDLINYEKIEKLSKVEIPEKIKRNNTNLLMIEELNEEKNKILEKLELIKELKKDIPNIKLYIIGEGVDRYAYETYIEDNELTDTIFLLGNKNNIYPYIKKSNYILFFNKQNLLLIMESLMLKTQVISTIKFTDDIISLDYLFNIAKNKIEYDLKKILLQKDKKVIKLNYEKINKEKLERLYKLLAII